jgi:hypothetical protein
MAALSLRYPEIVEYNEAVQHPATAFVDAELRQGRAETNPLGLPLVLSGGFALTYPMMAPRRRLALRCFRREIPAAQQKYAEIARALKPLHSAYFVGFDYIADGIRISGNSFPVLKMDWAEGETLGMWVGRSAGDRRAVTGLRERLAKLAVYLEKHGIAHGDIQNGNVIVTRKGVTMVDYDGLYVPGMSPDFACESGHRNFQHPARTEAHFGPTIDRFSFIATDLSLAALIEDPSLYRRFGEDGETILFRASDFADPRQSEIFSIVEAMPALRQAARAFAAICRADIEAVPSLTDFRAGRNIPQTPAPHRGAAPADVMPVAPLAAGVSRNRLLVEGLLTRPSEPQPARQPNPVATIAPRPNLNNRAIVRTLSRAAVQTAASPTPPSAPPGAIVAPSRPMPVGPSFATPRSATPGSATLRPPTIARNGSLIIHPRNWMPRRPPALSTLPQPSFWQRVRRFLGIEDD